jgi:hypothetical protein
MYPHVRQLITPRYRRPPSDSRREPEPDGEELEPLTTPDPEPHAKEHPSR